MPRKILTSLCTVALSLAFVSGCDEKKSEPAPAPAAVAPAPAAPAPAAAPADPAAAAPTAAVPSPAAVAGAAAPAAGAAPAAAAAPAGGKGSVKGAVTLTGKAPEMAELKRASDPYCAKTKMKDEEVISKGGKLANVLIHINGAPAAEPPATKASIEQHACMYRPRVSAIVAGQALAIKNGDATLHNVHTYKGTQTVFNQAQVPNTPEIEKKFSDNGALLKFKCDVHQWMTGYVWVQNNPYVAVTGEDGSFEIKDVPAGKYEVEAWHERFGTKKGEVVISADKPAELKFEFAATDTAK